MGKNPKINPRNRPATQEDVNRAHDRGYAEGVENTALMFLYVLYNKEHADQEIIQRVHDELDDAFDGIKKGYFTFADVRRSLKLENETEVSNH